MSNRLPPDLAKMIEGMPILREGFGLASDFLRTVDDEVAALFERTSDTGGLAGLALSERDLEILHACFLYAHLHVLIGESESTLIASGRLPTDN